MDRPHRIELDTATAERLSASVMARRKHGAHRQSTNDKSGKAKDFA
jgi:hypothetical protein